MDSLRSAMDRLTGTRLSGSASPPEIEQCDDADGVSWVFISEAGDNVPRVPIPDKTRRTGDISHFKAHVDYYDYCRSQLLEVEAWSMRLRPLFDEIYPTLESLQCLSEALTKYKNKSHGWAHYKIKYGDYELRAACQNTRDAVLAEQERLRGELEAQQHGWGTLAAGDEAYDSRFESLRSATCAFYGAQECLSAVDEISRAIEPWIAMEEKANVECREFLSSSQYPNSCFSKLVAKGKQAIKDSVMTVDRKLAQALTTALKETDVWLCENPNPMYWAWQDTTPEEAYDKLLSGLAGAERSLKDAKDECVAELTAAGSEDDKLIRRRERGIDDALTNLGMVSGFIQGPFRTFRDAHDKDEHAKGPDDEWFREKHLEFYTAWRQAGLEEFLESLEASSSEEIDPRRMRRFRHSLQTTYKYLRP